MPGAKTHDTIAFISSLAVAPASYAVLVTLGEGSEQAAAGAGMVLAAHLAGSWWLSPDLDIDGAIDNRWGPFFWIWRPYMWLVPHRHRLLSHSGFSALLRLLYLYLVISILLSTASLIATLFSGLPQRAYHTLFSTWIVGLIADNPREAILIAAGVVISDFLHTITDFLVTDGQSVLRLFGIRIRREYRGHDRRGARRRR